MKTAQNEINPKKVALGLSGGVDSSVAADLLQKQGYDVTGVYIQCWDAKADGCTAEQDRKDAVTVANKLGIKFISLDFIADYKSKVIEYFYAEYKAGRTPNPDVMCNKEIKFGLFLDWALQEGFDFIATGHYAGVTKINDIYQLLAGKDQTKDQSYFLYLLTQKQLEKVLFPLWEMTKEEVRTVASQAGLATFDKPDSVGICFIGEVDIKDFLQKEIALSPGDVFNTAGEVIGTHDGVSFYTIGQRHGFKITKYVGLPLYVVGKNVEKNQLIVGHVQDVVREGFFVEDMHWISGLVPNMPLKCSVRIRHLGELYACSISCDGNLLKVSLTEEVFGLAPGQSAVFYLDNVVLGGGIIS